MDEQLSPELQFAVTLAATDSLRVDETNVETPDGLMRVSTVLQPARAVHNLPNPYETLIIDADGDDIDGDCYPTREAAQAGHDRIVARLRDVNPTQI